MFRGGLPVLEKGPVGQLYRVDQQQQSYSSHWDQNSGEPCGVPSHT